MRRWTVRDLLLGLGVFSLIVALVSFAVVSWNDLSTVGRVAVVIGATTAVGAMALALHRHTMTATAEAVTVFWAALLVADVAAGRVLLLADSPPLVVWAGGMAGVAALLLGLSQITCSRAAPALALLAAAVPLPLLALDRGSEIMATAAGLAGFALALVSSEWVTDRSARFGSIAAGAVAHLSWALAAVTASIATRWNGPLGVAFALAAVVVLATGAHWVSRDRSKTVSTVWLAQAAVLILPAAATLTLRATAGPWVVLAFAGSAAIVLAAAVRLRHPGKLGAVAIAGVGLLFISVSIMALTTWAASRLARAVPDPWSGELTERIELTDLQQPSERIVVLALVAILVATVADQLRGRPQLRRAAAAVMGSVSLILFATVLGMPVWAATVLFLAVAFGAITITKPTRWLEADAAAAVLGGLGIAISLATPELTIGALATTSVVFFVISYRSAPGSLRSLWLASAGVFAIGGLVIAATANAGWADADIALAVIVAVGVLSLPLVLATILRDVIASIDYLKPPILQWAIEGSMALSAIVALVVVSASGGAGQQTAGLLIVAALCTLHAVRPQRSWLVVGAGACTAAAAAVQLHAADVTLVEAYALPAAAASAVFGYWAYRQNESLSSWITWGPATAIALVPSLAVSLGTDAGYRPLLLPLAAVAVVGVGLSARLQAPVLVGAAVVSAVGLDFLVTLASGLPRWVPFAAMGFVLILGGANFERSRDRAQDLVLKVQDLH